MVAKDGVRYYAKEIKSERTKPLEGEVRAKVLSALEKLKNDYYTTVTFSQISKESGISPTWESSDGEKDFEQIASEEVEEVGLRRGEKSERHDIAIK